MPVCAEKCTEWHIQEEESIGTDNNSAYNKGAVIALAKKNTLFLVYNNEWYCILETKNPRGVVVDL